MWDKYRKLWLLRLVKGFNLLVTAFLFCLCWELFYKDRYVIQIGMHGEMVMYAVYTIMLFMLQHIYGTYELGSMRASEIAYSAVLANFMVDALAYILVALAWQCMPNPLPMIGALLLQSAWICFWALEGNFIYSCLHPSKRTVIVCRKRSDLEKLTGIKRYANKFDVQKYIYNPQDIHQLISEIQGYEVIFVVGINATLRNGIAKYCVEQDIDIYIEPKIGDILMAGARNMKMFSIPIMRIRRRYLIPEYLVVKRAIDIVASLVGIVVLSPVMLAVAAAIKLCDKGPVLYRQTRLTKGGKTFEILKFRSMRVDAEKDGVARLSSGDKDDRVTPVGRFIRACRLDELPQLFNILAGSMTIVGPRPERPEIAAQYEKELPAFRLRLQVKAGLTGYAQIYGRYNTLPYDKLQMDLMYINGMSILEDLRLMLATVKVLFMKESTEGVENSPAPAMDAQNTDISDQESA